MVPKLTSYCNHFRGLDHLFHTKDRVCSDLQCVMCFQPVAEGGLGIHLGGVLQNPIISTFSPGCKSHLDVEEVFAFMETMVTKCWPEL